MANTIKVLFWVRRSKENKEGLSPLMLRLTYQGQKAEKSTGYHVPSRRWDVKRQKIRGPIGKERDINEWIDLVQAKLIRISKGVLETNDVHLSSLIDSFFAKAKEEPFLLSTIKEHNDQLLLRVGKDYSYSTYEKYVFTYDKVKAFVQDHLKRKDMLLREVTTSFIVEFDHYLRVHDNNQHNTAVKYCLNLKRVFNLAVLKGIIPRNPFTSYKTIYKDTPQVYLSPRELSLIENARLIYPKHTLTRDLFLFQCYTGLAYSDLIGLRIKDISSDNNGNKWIIKRRQKTDITATIPLLSVPLQLIDKYKDKSRNELFPHYSIQKYNQYLGEIGDLVGIQKKLSSHVGRRTFGNVALTKGISINVISKILGHSNTLITQRIYAITTQSIISKEIEKWT